MLPLCFFLFHVGGALLLKCLLTLGSRKPFLFPDAFVLRAPRALVRRLGLLIKRQRSLRLLLLLRTVEFAVVDVHVFCAQRLAAGFLRGRFVFGRGLLCSFAVRFTEQTFYILQQCVNVFCVRLIRLMFLSGLH